MVSMVSMVSPKNGWIIGPPPAAIDYPRIVIGNVYDFLCCGFNDNVFVFVSDFQVLKLI